MKRNRIHALTGILLSLILSFCIPVWGIEASAEEKPAAYAEKNELLSGFGLGKDQSSCKIKFGKNERKWDIAGQDGTDILVLFFSRGEKEPDFGTSKFNEEYKGNTYGDDKDKFKKSKVKEFLENCEPDEFSTSELNLIKDTTVKTTDSNGRERSVTGKLYLPGAENSDSFGADTIYVGSENNIPILTENVNTAVFWLRTPSNNTNINAGVLTAGSSTLNNYPYYSIFSVRPAMNLDVSSVLFASSAPIKAEGTWTFPEDAAMTLRFSPAAGTANGKVCLKGTDRAVEVSSAPAGTYLVVQNSAGAWATKVSGEQFILPEEVTIGDGALSSFADCKVWLERTDRDRITTAVMAEQGTSNVTVTAGKNMILKSGSLSQTGLNGAMGDVVYEAAEGYYFPKDYAAGINGQNNGVTVRRDSRKQITITGTPVKDTAITLLDASRLKQPAVPTLAAITYSPARTLADAAFPPVDGGSWSWDDDTVVPEVKTASYKASFTPDAESEYDTYYADIALKVEKAEPKLSSVTGSGTYGQKLSEFAFSGSAVCDGRDVPGSFNWKDGELYPECGQTLQYPYEFIPDDKDNYNAVSGSADVTVSKKPVTVSIEDAGKTYGDANPEFSFTVPDGALEGDDTEEDLAVTFACNADETTGAGNVADITGSSAAKNYDVTAEKGTLTVNQRPIHIKVTDKDIKYKEPLPSVYDFTLSNLVNGADAVSVGAAAKIEPQKVPAGNPAGSYVLKVADWSITDSNYTKGQSQDGTLTIHEDMSGHGGDESKTDVSKTDVSKTDASNPGNEKTVSQEVKAVKTGDPAPIMGLTVMSVISVMIITAAAFRRKKRRT